MEHPAKCPLCPNDSLEPVGSDFDEFNSIIEHSFYCPDCGTEWKVPFVMVEKIITREGTIPSFHLP